MRTSDVLERLSAAAPAVLAQAESLVDSSEEDRILARILASKRGPDRRRTMFGQRPLLLLAGAAIVAAAVVASLELRHGTSPRATGPGRHHVVLSSATIRLAGYRFRLPAGYKPSSASCASASSGSGPTPVLNSFAAAAAADGGCVEAAFLIGDDPSPPAGADPIDVGPYSGYLLSQGGAEESTLYVELPNAGGPGNPAYLVLLAQGLTLDQLVAVALSGLPASP